eukprot:6197466-Amphidinium_carterae.1
MNPVYMVLVMLYAIPNWPTQPTMFCRTHEFCSCIRCYRAETKRVIIKKTVTAFLVGENCALRQLFDVQPAPNNPAAASAGVLELEEALVGTPNRLPAEPLARSCNCSALWQDMQ